MFAYRDHDHNIVSHFLLSLFFIPFDVISFQQLRELIRSLLQWPYAKPSASVSEISRSCIGPHKRVESTFRSR